jgi:hypothetical protein
MSKRLDLVNNLRVFIFLGFFVRTNLNYRLILRANHKQIQMERLFFISFLRKKS